MKLARGFLIKSAPLAIAFACWILVFPLRRACAQDPTQITPGINVGFPESGIFDGADFDTVQVTNGKLHIEVPLYSSKGRGSNLFIKFVYDAPSYYDDQITDQHGDTYDRYKMTAGGGWRIVTPTSYSISVHLHTVAVCPVGSGNRIIYTGIILTEPDGTKHHFVPDQVNYTCYTNVSGSVLYADDGSGWMLKVDPVTSNPIGTVANVISFDAIRRDGTEIKGTSNSNTQVSVYTLTDSNGNQIVENLTSTTRSVTDTLGRTISIPNYGVTPGQYQVNYLDSSGQSQHIQFTLANYSQSTNFCQPPSVFCTDFHGQNVMPTQIVLPNGLQYTFTPGASGFGEMIGATLPTGAQIAWAWQPGAFSIDEFNPEVSSRTVTANGQNSVWTYQYTSNTLVTDPSNNDTRYTLTNIVSQGPGFTIGGLQPTKVEYFSGSASSGTLLKTVATDYSNAATVLPIRDTTTWTQTNQVSKVETDWDSYNTSQVTITWRNPINKREYAFGTGAPGSLVRTTSFNYLHLTNSSYRTANIASKLTSQILYEADGVTVHSRALYAYDGTTISGTTGVVSHDYTNFGSTNTIRGNASLVQRWRNTDSIYLNTTNYYNDLGNLIQTQDAASHNTYFDYTDSWADSPATCAPATGTTQAFVTKMTNTLTQFVKAKYSSCTSLTGSTTDLNSQTTTYLYDALGRRLQVTFPDGGQKSVTYGTTLPINNVTTTKISTTPTVVNLTATAVLDDLGRVKQTQLNSDPDGVTSVDSAYDGLGRKSTESNPHRSASLPTDGTTTYVYDALSRVSTLIPPDGSMTANNVSTSYSGSCTTVTDQTGKIRKSCSDALGRLIQVLEPDASNNLTLETDYQYDVADNLTCVEQHGGVSGTGCSSPPSSDPTSAWRVRRFTYNSLSQLLSASNPESDSVPGTTSTVATTYAYDSEGKLQTKTAPAPNQSSTAMVVTTFAYDALHRVTQKSFSDSTPLVNYAFDGNAPTGCSPTLTITNGVGRRTAMCDAAGWEAWSYDVMGGVLTDRRTTNSVTKDTTYAYNLDGSVYTIGYPSGRTITYAPGAAGRPLSAKDTANSINYATNALYAPQGAFSSVTNGASIVSTFYYDKRLQPCRISVKYSGTAPGSCTDAVNIGNVLDFQYDFGLGTADNGNVNKITNNRSTGRSISYTYDTLNRIKSAITDGTSGSTCWAQLFGSIVGGNYVSGYDNWGNLQNITPDPSRPGCSVNVLSQAADLANRISGYCYDTAGNLLGQTAPPCPAPTYVFNAENQLVTAVGVSYVYDGDGKRVKKSSGKLYWYGAGSDALIETDLSGNTNNSTFEEYVFFAGKRIARRDSSSNVDYYFADHLGTAHIVGNSSGTVLDDSDFYPFGGERVITSSSGNTYKFTGKEHDSESGLDYFGARYYGSNMGRFTSPDSKMFSRQRMFDPQQWNMYQYSRNNPVTMVDPDGREVKVAAELQKSYDHLMKSQSFRNAIAPYQGKDNPNLTIQRGTLGKDPMEPNRQVLGNTKPSIAPSIQNCSSATSCTTIPAKLKDATITIDNSVGEGKGEKQTEGVLAHEASHANDAVTDPQGYMDENAREANKLHDDRSEEKHADQFSDTVRKEVKQEEKKEKKEKKEKPD